MALRYTWILVLLGAMSISSLADEGYRKVTGPCGFQFPRDHGAHEAYRTEWWYYTGNLTAENGHRFGYQFTVFRYRLSPPTLPQTTTGGGSHWRTPHIYLGHIALSDITEKAHYHDDDTVRGALTLAGVRQHGGQTSVFLKQWRVDIDDKDHHIQAGGRQFGFDLHLRPIKPIVLHGEQGYSRKGTQPEQASCYYSYTRMETTGTVNVGQHTVTVEGLSWMDHEFSTAPLAPGILGWDWFSIQMDDLTELMLYRLRLEEGGVHPASSATFVGPAGDSRHLAASDFKVQVLDHWKSPHSGASYPARWEIRIPSMALVLSIRSNLADQEMQTRRSTGITYWEGSVAVAGQRGDKPIGGQGYVELTGYAEKFDAPL